MSTWLCTLHYVEAAGPARVVGWRSAGPDRQEGESTAMEVGSEEKRKRIGGIREEGKPSVDRQGFLFTVPFIMVHLTLTRIMLLME